MKKFKRVIPFLLAMITALAITLAGCNSCNNGNNDDGGEKAVLQSISVDASNAKTDYFIGEQFTAQGLTVTAVLTNPDKTVALSEDDYTVDSSAFNSSEAGVYAIGISYTFDGVTKNGAYNVTVKARPEFEGLEVKLAEGTEDTFNLSAETKKVEIDTTKIVVKEVNDDGSVGNEITDYTAKLFRGKEEIPLTDGKAMVGAGAYAIWVEKISDVTSFNRTGFVLVYVNDTMTGFEFKEGTLSQPAGVDVISDTWKFTATYVTGVTKEIASANCSFDLDTFTVGKNTVTVTYTDYDAKGTGVTKTTDVEYTTVVPPQGTTLNYKYVYGAIDASGITADKTPLKQSNLKGANAFLKLYDPTGAASDYNYAQYRSADLGGSDVVEIKGVGFYVTFYGTGTITIGFSSSGGSNSSSVGFMDGTGSYIATATQNVKTYTKANTYVVSGTATTELTFTVTKPGTYAIVGHVDKSDKSFNKAARIHSIVMVDNV